MVKSEQRRGIVSVAFTGHVGRLGNHVAQYCIGRILASELDRHLVSESKPGFPNVSCVLKGPVEISVEGEVLELTGHRLDLAELRRQPLPDVMVIKGHFLRYENFQPHKTAIRESWLVSDRAIEKMPADVLTIHVRSGDIWKIRTKRVIHAEMHALPFSYYEEIVSSRPWSRILVVSEDAGDPMVQKLASRFGAEVRSGSPLDDFNQLRASANLVLSVSSFAWWAGWLSQAQRIYYPVVGLFDPDRQRLRPFERQPDFWVSDEERFIAIRPPDVTGDWRGGEDDRQRLLDSQAPCLWNVKM
jgi:hypothetical protein